jgi:hypothetical protein
MLATGADYHDLGPDYFARLNPERLTRYYVKKLQALGHNLYEATKPPSISSLCSLSRISTCFGSPRASPRSIRGAVLAHTKASAARCGFALGTRTN